MSLGRRAASKPASDPQWSSQTGRWSSVSPGAGDLGLGTPPCCPHRGHSGFRFLPWSDSWLGPGSLAGKPLLLQPSIQREGLPLDTGGGTCAGRGWSLDGSDLQWRLKVTGAWSRACSPAKAQRQGCSGPSSCLGAPCPHPSQGLPRQVTPLILQRAHRGPPSDQQGFRSSGGCLGQVHSSEGGGTPRPGPTPACRVGP